MLQNAYSLAKIGADTAENERSFAEILPKIGNYPAAVAAERGPGLLRGHQRHGGHGPAEAGEAHEKEGARAAG